jgi:hypothetical protein
MTQQEYWEKRFKETEGKPPETQWQLMQYASIMEAQAKEHSSFWKGVFGL